MIIFYLPKSVVKNSFRIGYNVVNSFRTYNRAMLRQSLRVVSFLLLLAAAVLAPLVASGYFELNKASSSGNYVEVAEHYTAAAQRLPWRADLYELAGHVYYHARDYSRAEAVYRKAFER